MHQSTWLGIALVLIGIVLVFFPIISKVVDFSSVPGWLIYIYKSDGFYFVTSPILIVFSIISLVLYFLIR